MINCASFFELLSKRGVDFFTGVPDSLLKDFCAYVTDNVPSDKHIIAANEGGSVALACGHYLASRKMALVYMQNSGQGNAVNPLASLSDPDVYSIPMLLLIGWRGQPGIKDEPQHIKQGKITLDLLNVLGVPYRILGDTAEQAKANVNEAIDIAEKSSAPVAIVVEKGTFESYKLKSIRSDVAQMSREQAIELVAANLDSDDVVVSTTGKTSRELYEYRHRCGDGHSRDFLTVGSMGHASQIAMGIALEKKSRQVFCFDGDGAAIMHMGAFAIIGSQKAKNFKHIIFNNGAHDSVGGQPTAGMDISFTAIADASGYELTLQAESPDQIPPKIEQLKIAEGPALLEILVNKGARDDLGRPKESPQENKEKFMEFLSR